MRGKTNYDAFDLDLTKELITTDNFSKPTESSGSGSTLGPSGSVSIVGGDPFPDTSFCGPTMDYAGKGAGVMVACRPY